MWIIISVVLIVVLAAIIIRKISWLKDPNNMVSWLEGKSGRR